MEMEFEEKIKHTERHTCTASTMRAEFQKQIMGEVERYQGWSKKGHPAAEVGSTAA